MKESVKIDATLVEKVRKRVKKTKQTMGGFIEAATEKSLKDTEFETHDNSNKFIEYLVSREIRHKSNGHTTIIIGVHDPIALGVAFGIYKAQNDPAYIRNAANEFVNKM